ncbi:WD repeat protein [Talaromyces proteolyticus]|uniref:WD repeat protein n=1 Tax=Talaromyces proteolyticus TaxID=1131652 RepID=A0AAD4KTP0_9EURO|nr:WD repeat protein [Talaromyces proteolyticus]KAH8696660.1 WD repeat protein [Talaromyces proteolyticus]
MAGDRNATDVPQSDPVHIHSPPEIPSSPPSIVSEAGYRRKPKRPPPVTPRSFRKFFTPRSSLNSTGNGVYTSRQALKELGSTSLNRRGPAFMKAAKTHSTDHGILKSPFLEPAKTPSRKRKLSFSSSGSPPQSSPLRKVRLTTAVYENRGTDKADKTVNDIYIPVSPERILSPRRSIQKQLFSTTPPAQPLRRSKALATSGGLCLRSVSGRMNRLTLRSNYGSGWQDQASNFSSRPDDHHQSINISGDRLALPVCIAPCKTNSLVAIGDEEGGIRLLDSAKGVKNGFSNAHLSFRAHGNSILNLEFSSDDLLLATAAGDQTTLIIDMTTQKPIHCLSNHSASVKHVQFQPGSNDRMVATCSRDGNVNIWDLRCRGHEMPPLQIRCSLASEDDEPSTPLPKINYPQPIRTIQDAHTLIPRASKLATLDKPETQLSQENVAVTSLSFLPAGRENLFVTASSANACVKLWDMRTSYNIRKGHPVPLSTTREPDCHVSHRSWGVTSMALNGDGSRLYTLCRDAYVYAYSTSHLILGGSPDINLNNNRPRRTGGPNKEGLGPLYRFGHPGLQVSSFYVKTAVRPAQDDRGEMLAVGNSEHSAVLFSTDEKFLVPSKSIDEAQSPTKAQTPSTRRALRRANSEIGLSGRPESTVPTYQTGTRLVGGHQKEVSAVAWAHGGELVTVSDDFSARCWREGADARELRTGGEADGRRWRCGWAETPHSYNDEEE